MITLTVDQVMAWGPCHGWPRARLEEIAAGRAEVPLLEILRRDDLPIDDRIWVGSHAMPEFGRWVADRNVRIHAPARLDAAGLHEYARRLRDLPEIVDVETASAAWAARAAAWAALNAWNAWNAWDAARAAWDAAWDTARDAERHLQLARLIEMAGNDREARRKS